MRTLAVQQFVRIIHQAWTLPARLTILGSGQCRGRPDGALLRALNQFLRNPIRLSWAVVRVQQIFLQHTDICENGSASWGVNESSLLVLCIYIVDPRMADEFYPELVPEEASVSAHAGYPISRGTSVQFPQNSRHATTGRGKGAMVG